MSYYTDDAVKAKLSSLNDTHDSVVNVAQWLLFHRFVALTSMCLAHHAAYRRHSARTAELWLSKLKDTSPVKRLSLVYLVNGALLLNGICRTDKLSEVVQQSRARRKEDFVNAFTPVCHTYNGMSDANGSRS
jgi:regulator of Ty1 transposition protein 103